MKFKFFLNNIRIIFFYSVIAILLFTWAFLMTVEITLPVIINEKNDTIKIKYNNKLPEKFYEKITIIYFYSNDSTTTIIRTKWLGDKNDYNLYTTTDSIPNNYIKTTTHTYIYKIF